MGKAEFLKGMRMLTSSYMKEVNEDTISAWYLQFKEITAKKFYGGIDRIIKKSRFFPTVTDLLQECNQYEIEYCHFYLEKMRQENYFKHPSEFDKVCMWINKGIIPGWLKEDMKKYGYTEALTFNTSKNLLEG